jgi:two-component system nitrogen regulation response regulator GlnG
VRELENLMRRLAALERAETIGAAAVAAGLGRAGAPKISAGGVVSPESGLEGEADSLAAAAAVHIDRYFARFGAALPPEGVYERLLAEVERPLLRACLAATGGNQLKAARLLGLNRNTLRKKLNVLKIDGLSERQG